jgi:AraC-like DNA-binding protein
VLDREDLLAAAGLRVATVRCAGGPATGADEPVATPAVILVRRGVFVRRVDGAASAADPTVGYVQRPGEWQHITHPAGGDVCTALTVPPELADRVAHAGPVLVTPPTDLAHRRLLTLASRTRAALAGSRARPAPLASRARPAVPSSALAGTGPAVPSSALAGTAPLVPSSADGRTGPPVSSSAGARAVAGLAADPGTPAAVGLLDLAAEVIAGLLPAPRPVPRLVDEVRAALHTDPDLALDDLARLVDRSPWHVSRTFHRATGTTLGAYRRRLRVSAVLDALAEGDDPPGLAALAAETGFADQAHMTRALRREIRMPPGAARRLLAPG